MDLYFSNCRKAAEPAARKAAARSLSDYAEECRTTSRKKPITEVGASHLLDLPLGVKLPVFPGSSNVFYTTNISEKLHQPSYDFNLTDPYCQLLETSYKSLHDPHLKAYYKRKDILRKLKKGGYITSSNKVVCTLKELNKYRHYLTSLKLDFERNYIREQKMLEEQISKLYETKRAHENSRFHKWLLQERTQATPDQELLIKNRYLDMISRELDNAENHNKFQMHEKGRHHQDDIRRKLSLHREIEKEWKTKEMLLLAKIGDEVKREAKIGKQRQKISEAAHQKKCILLEKKMTYHLQKMQRIDLKRGGPEGSIFESKEQGESEGLGQHSHSFIKVSTKTSSTLLPPQHDVKSNTTEQKRDKEITKTPHLLNDEGIKRISFQCPGVSDKTKNIPRHSIQDVLKQEMTYADSHGKKAKKSSLNYDSAHRIFPSCDSIKQQNYQNHCQEKVASGKSSHNFKKPSTSKVELLKDVQSKKDLIIQLVTRDINQEVSENKENLTSDEDEAVLQEVVKEGFPDDPLGHQVKEDVNPIESTVAFLKPLMSKRSLQKFWSLRKCHPKSSITTTNIEASPIQWTESEETQMRIRVPKVNVPTSKSLTDTDPSFWDRKTQLSREEITSSTEPTHYFIHRIMSKSSYNEEDLPSFSSGDDDRSSDPSAKVTEDSFELESASNVQFVTLYRRESALASPCSSSDGISDTDKPSTPGSEKMRKVSSALSKVFSRSKSNVSKSSSTSLPHQDRGRGYHTRHQ